MATTGQSVGYGLNCLGIALGCVGSISINIGNNLQAKGHADKAAAGGTLPPGAPNLWALGTGVFFLASILLGSGVLMVATGVIQLQKVGITSFRPICGRAGAAARVD